MLAYYMLGMLIMSLSIITSLTVVNFQNVISYTIS